MCYVHMFIIPAFFEEKMGLCVIVRRPSVRPPSVCRFNLGFNFIFIYILFV